MLSPSLIVAAHPDDETIGLGGQLHVFQNLTILHVTDGAPRSTPDPAGYAATRRRELECALEIAGIDPACARRLGRTDQEVFLDLTGLALELADLFRKAEPGVVYTHPYEGGHPDHDATAFAAHAACCLVQARPALREFTSYHERGGRMETGEFLPNGGHDIITVVLSKEASQRKRRMFDCFASQREMLAAFSCDAERTRSAPRYFFTRSPAESLWYDRFAWGAANSEWLARARAALAELGLQEPL